jgi:hypothetical protein
MNNKISSLYTCCIGNRVVLVESNLSEFVKLFNKMTGSNKSYNWYYRRFNKLHEFAVDKYYFQRVV